MNKGRLQRLSELIKETSSEIIQRRMKDPRIAPLTSVTAVEVSPDLGLARIHVSVMGDETARENTMAALNSGKGFFRTELGRSIEIRHVPEIVFKLDESIERGARILEIMSQLEREAQSPGDVRASGPGGGAADGLDRGDSLNGGG